MTHRKSHIGEYQCHQCEKLFLSRLAYQGHFARTACDYE